MATPRARAIDDRTALIAFMAVALVLRLPGHLNSGLWYDEMWLLLESIRVPFATVFTSFESDNNHPFYTVLAWLSVHAFGESAWALRLPALIFGVASVGMMWKLALLVTDRAEAALATALLTVSYHHVWFSQNARGYTMLLFWSLAATYFLIRTYAGARRAWIWYALCLAAATFTHASAVLVALAQGVVSLAVLLTSRSADRASRSRWAPLMGLALAGVVSLVAHAGMLGDMLAYFTGGSADGLQPMEPGAGPSQWTSVWWTVSAVVESLGLPAGLGWVALAGGIVLVVTGTVVVVRRNWIHGLLFTLPGVAAVGATVALGRSLRPRFLFHLGGFGALILVAGLFTMCRWLSRWAPEPKRGRTERALEITATVAVVAASLAILPRAYTLPKQDFEGALEYVLAARAQGDAVAVTGLTVLPYREYYGIDFPEVRSTQDLDSLLSTHDAVLVLNTLPIFLESTIPSLARRLEGSEEVARFRGSLGDGDVVVYRLTQ